MHTNAGATMFTEASLTTASAGNNPGADIAQRWEGAKSSLLLTQQSSLPRKEPDTADWTQELYLQTEKANLKEKAVDFQGLE